MSAFVDTHAHLQEAEFADDRAAVIERAAAAGVGTIIVPGTDLASAEAAVDLAERFAGVYATVGFHPHEASLFSEGAYENIGALATHPKVVAIGEIGLDFHYMHSPREAQIEALEVQLRLAAHFRLPVVIHCRDAWDALPSLVEPWVRRVAADYAGAPLGVLHYFASTPAEAQQYYELGFLISLHTSVTHPKSQQMRDVAAALPLAALVIETDSPYGAPQVVRGKRNEPANVVESASAIATVRGISLEDVAAATTANARRLFRLDAVEARLAGLSGELREPMAVPGVPAGASGLALAMSQLGDADFEGRS